MQPLALWDEVAVLAGAVVLVLALVLAWLSTYVGDGSSELLGTGDTAVIHLGALPPFVGAAGGAEAPEPPGITENTEEKEEEEGAAAQGESGNVADPSLELDVQSLSEPCAMGEVSAPGEGELCPGLMKIRLKFLNDTEEVALAWPEDTVGILK
ncbi:PREDICTED: transmembrane and ubiquitin-like domain-containing protein 2, partial [Acanthisitta chloris]|uniref:transmembrane and ubiquitin-like domain-containing protein 2 n=1 Tax=Acanthisitta chloris TaxID=57068 RepID=UPI0004F0E9B5